MPSNRQYDKILAEKYALQTAIWPIYICYNALDHRGTFILILHLVVYITDDQGSIIFARAFDTHVMY